VKALIDGTCSREFESVRDAFIDNLEQRGEIGAAVAVTLHGETVVDLWGGCKDSSTGELWREDTIADFYSAGKPLIATLLLRELEKHSIDLDAPIATVWPEFAQAGKERATIRQALCHRAGVPAIRAELTNDDLWCWDTMTTALAETRPWFEPGSRHVYHTNTYGHLVGEMARRLSGLTPHELLANLSSDLGLDLHFGVASSDLERCAAIVWDSAQSPVALPPDDGGEGSMILRGYFNPPGYSSMGVVNTEEWRRAQVPSTNGHGSARGLAGFYAALLEPGKLLSESMIKESTSVQSSGPCPVLAQDVSFGLGFQPSTSKRPFGPDLTSFGHFGTGGAVGFADPGRGLAVGYVMNRVIPRWQSTCNRALISAVYSSL
jgi:CubicO group peptidase (beta-lactamase class C family)